MSEMEQSINLKIDRNFTITPIQINFSYTRTNKYNYTYSNTSNDITIDILV